ncbi:hypothetical protein JCM10914A_26980 [Paenibacillus sp. JCM 10914]|uniref:ABC transporter permease n=1 Tax=Paenibacillus sp. JCM 10914 TaxID=1236974 RepID=UPI0003CC8081|nr:ABC transporter permease [Paenibacillus sp. JCM 10914]GAE08208.1 hypothetical protein JCM10914_4497 [Paenibacillus sp. JCM 10914]
MNRSNHFKSPRSLFWRRWRAHLKYQRDNLASVADWTVMLYIIVPGLLLGGGIYREFWTRPLPEWMHLLPLPLVSAFLLFMFSGRVLLFLEEADVLFLRQQPRWVKTLMIRGILYSYVVSVIKGLLALILVLPIVVRGHGISGSTLLSMLALTAALAWCGNMLARIIRARSKGWRRHVITFFSRVLTFALLSVMVTLWLEIQWLIWLSVVLLLFLLVQLSQYRISMQGTFMMDVREDANTRMQLTEKMLIQAVGKPPSVRSKSWIFRRSGRIYKGSPEKRLADAGIKAILRNPESLMLYIQITLVGIPAIWIPPLVIKIMVYIAMIILISYWLNTRWTAFARAEFMNVLPFTNEQYHLAGKLTIRTLMVLPALLYSLVAGLTLFAGATGWLIAVGGTIIAVYGFSSIAARPMYKEDYLNRDR